MRALSRTTFGRAALVLLVFALGLGLARAGAEDIRGPVTNLPLPRFVSIKAAEANVRRGPSLTHRIDWVFKRRNLPVEITAEHGHWRRVRDRDGAGGWVHYALLSGVRYVIVTSEMLDLLAKPEEDARVMARLEGGVVAQLGACEPFWCRIEAGGFKGWAPKSALWGVKADEIRE
ncbi:SH3-like domain-containing protein [Poseidonocella sedimentorum]|uniref:SH3-like domain-containing protein n=2 Tax=Poseidonocella sedimentorum TaxID=871652 RepID=A0A1I6D3N8_9RHOB|nr:SH3-like domain-containing protein [Poseidonocella sedimentorum]